MEGRALVDYMAQELSQAVSTNSDLSDFNVPDGGNTAMFSVLGDATASPAKRCIHSINYALAGGTVTRVMDGAPAEMGEGIDGLKFVVGPPSVGLPLFVDVRITITNMVYESRAHFVNRDRYRM